MKIGVFAIFITILLSVSCKQGGENNSGVSFDSIDLSDRSNILRELDTIGAGIPIFYNMYLSVELSSLFEATGAIFTKEILNPTDKTSEYLTSYRKAMNLGIFAVDLSYARVFEQYEVAGRYFSAMQNLSEKLGIPTTYVENTAHRLEKNLTNKDSLIAIANEVYYDTEEYLKENERFATASVIILGGWIEAIYIGTHVAIESRSADIIERLVDQKYSLNNLLIMLSDYQEIEAVAEYLEKLEKLRIKFMSIEIDIPYDFNENSAEAKTHLDNWVKEIKVLQDEILIIRTDMTE